MGKRKGMVDLSPALQFISGARSTESEQKTPGGGEAEKGLRPSEPGYIYMSSPVSACVQSPPPGYKANPEYLEKKTRRVQLLMRPSLYEAMKTQAEAGGVSVNEIVDRILSDFLKKTQEE